MKKMFKFGCGGLIAIFVLIIVIAMVGGSDEENETANESATSTDTNSEVKQTEDNKEEEPKEEILTAGIGQALKVGDVEFTINSSEITNEIKDSSGYITESPSADGATFLVIDATVKNLSKEKINTSSSFFKVLTADGLTYEASSIWFDGFFLFEEINPNLGQTGKIAFEIPEGLSDLSIQVQTGFWGTETGVIKLN